MSSAESKSLSLDEFKLLTERAGLNLTPEDLERLKPQFQQYLEQLKVLHDLDLESEEPVVTFYAQWRPGE